jgi:hypothetical protein
MGNIDVLEKVQKLCTLALSEEDGEPTEEARTAAITATRLMKEHDLVIVPREQLEAAQKAINGATELRREAKKAKRDGMILGGVLGVMAGKQGLI